LEKALKSTADDPGQIVSIPEKPDGKYVEGAVRRAPLLDLKYPSKSRPRRAHVLKNFSRAISAHLGELGVLFIMFRRHGGDNDFFQGERERI
jgi:hypothetical protein